MKTAILVSLVASAAAFAPAQQASSCVQLAGSGTALTAASNADLDLVLGFGVIAAACTPYVCGIVYPDFFEEYFFLPIYNEDEDGRAAEIGWKVRYAALGLSLTLLAFLEVKYFPEHDPTRILRDSYVLWALFYTEATRKIRVEAKANVLRNPDKRFGIQLWHSIVVILLWADVSESVTGNAIEKIVIDTFS